MSVAMSPAPSELPITSQMLWLVVLSIPIASISWTITHEELFRECREFCVNCGRTAACAVFRKFFYMLTCEYCFSHYVTVTVLVLTRFRMLFDDWRGYVVAGFALVWMANVYITLHLLMRTNIKLDAVDADLKQKAKDSCPQ